MILRKEKVSFYSHLFGAIASIVCGVILFIMTHAYFTYRMIVLVYSVAVLWLFSASSIYHAQKKVENGTNIWRKFDHFAIFFMIAGTYTPLCFFYLDGPMKWGIIIAQWTVVAFGIFFKIFFLHAPRRLYTLIYLIMGWMVIIPIKDMYLKMPTNVFAFLFIGGLLYTIGSIMYSKKKPNPYPDFFGFHEIFHILIVAGAAFHFLTVYYTVQHFIQIG